MKIVIIGCGIAGLTAAKMIKEKDKTQIVKMFEEEEYGYYYRPDLIKFLAGYIKKDDLFSYKQEWFSEKGIELISGKKAIKIEPLKKIIMFDDTVEESYDKLILANGSSAFLPLIPGNDKKGVFTLRTLKDAIEILEYIKKSKRAIVVGGGLLGLESANAIANHGVETLVIHHSDRLLPQQLDNNAASLLKEILEKKGISVLLNAETEKIFTDTEAKGIILKTGEELYADFILFSTGIRPNIELAKTASLSINRGVLVDEGLRTSNPDIYAIGDIAEFKGRVYGIVPASLEQAKAAASIILGEPNLYKGTIPSNALKVVGIDLTSIGVVNPSDQTPECKEGCEEIKFLDKKTRTYKKLVISSNNIIGGILLGLKKDSAALTKIIKERIDISNFKDKLKNKDFNLTEIIK